jgi:Spy/CpxP family protein refolding chaperone
MKKGWTLFLLVSLGLNIGLGLRLLHPGHPLAVPEPVVEAEPEAAAVPWERPAPGDSTGWNRYMGRRMQHLAARLDLRPDQVDSFRAAQAATGRLLREKRRDLYQGRLRLREMMAAGAVDRPVLRQVMAELGHRQAEMDSLAAEAMWRELEVLDPSQRAVYLDLLPAAAGRHEGRGPRRMNRQGH